MNAVLGSLTDEHWKRTLISLRADYMETLESEVFSYWSIPAQGFHMSVTDYDLAKLVLNPQWFHEGMDPRLRDLLDSDHQ